MTLTANSDVTGRFKETAFNKILHEVMIQNPKTFNYATSQIIKSNSYCSTIAVLPYLNSTGETICTEVDKMPIVGTTSSGFYFCIQFKELKVDFNPSSVIQLPPELGNLVIQQFALKGKVCADKFEKNSENLDLHQALAQRTMPKLRLNADKGNVLFYNSKEFSNHRIVIKKAPK
jgi:hypothetical protein